MSRVSRRQFIATTAAGALAAPHVWVRSAGAQQKQLSILCWSHFVPAYDKPTRGVWRYDGRDEEFRPGESWRDAYRSGD